ncbi:MAG TPA: rod shape-determining protein MreC [Nitrospiraceae bacterium]|nr:rod shape-determining protein MreC [Nitrospiraceae bacterium]
MAILRSTYGTKRLAVVLFALLLAALFLLPSQSQGVLQFLGGPLGQVLSVPLEAFSSLDRGMTEIWDGYVALRGIREENRQLRKELEFVQGQNNQLREAAVATQRLEAILDFKQKSIPDMVAAQVIGRDATNWYRGIILNKGEQDGVHAEMGVVTPAGVVGRVVKATSSSSVVLLMTDPNNAIAALVQGTRDEGIVEGTRNGRARMKYIPLLSTVHPGDRVITSGLTGLFPRGLAIGVMTHIEKEEGDLFRSAELEPEVDMTKLDEVLVIRSPYEDSDASKKMIQGMPGEKKKP